MIASKFVTRAARWFVHGMWAWLTLKPGSRPRRMARRGVVALARFLLARPRLAEPARRLLQRFPAIEGRMRVMLSAPDAFRPPVQEDAKDLSDLSPRARRIYAELRAAIARRDGVC